MGHRLVSFGLLVVSLILIFTTLQSIVGMWGAGSKIVVEEKRVAALSAENQKLRQGIVQSESPDFVEEQIRDKLNMVKPGEEVVIIPPELLAGPAAVPTSKAPNWQKWAGLFF